MTRIDQLGVALGLATLAGLNLYLTVLVAGCAVRFQWIELSGSYEQMAVFGHPWVLGVAGTMFVVQVGRSRDDAPFGFNYRRSQTRRYMAKRIGCQSGGSRYAPRPGKERRFTENESSPCSDRWCDGCRRCRNAPLP